MPKNVYLRRMLIALALAGFVGAQVENSGLRRAVAMAKAGKFRVALLPLTAVLADQPDSVEALRWRGHCHAGLKEYRKALDDLDRVVKLDAENASGWFARGMAQHHLRRSKAAIADFGEALRRNQYHIKAREWRGYNLAIQGDYLGAYEDFTGAIQQDGKNASLFHARGRAAASLGAYARARKDFEAAILHAVDDPAHHAQLGFLLVAMGMDKLALESLNVAHRIDPHGQDEVRLWRYWLRGRLRKLTGNSADELPRKKWAGDRAKMLLGESTKYQLMSRLTAYGVDKRLKARRCEAAFCIGVRAMLVGQLNQAREAFRDALVIGDETMPEWRAARVLVQRR